MSSELELAGLPVTFSSTKVTKKSSKKNQKKKAQKKRSKAVKKSDRDAVEHFNYSEEFKVVEVLQEYRNPFTILMSKSERFKVEEEEEYFEDYSHESYESYEDQSQDPLELKEECELDYDLPDDTLVKTDDTAINNDPLFNNAIDSLVNTVIVPVDTTIPVDKRLYKYFHQRYDYFSLFDEGIRIDEEGWYSVTPEIIAAHIAKEAHSIALTYKSSASDSDAKTVIVDAFCGVGGNTIQFAKHFDRVIAIDLDAGRLEMARHNATIYGVVDRIQFIHGDVFQVLPELQDEQVDLVFMSPPWGGPDYINCPVFYPRRDLMDQRGDELFQLGRKISKNLILFLPRQTDIFSIAEMLKSERSDDQNDYLDQNESFVVEQHWLRNRIKAISIYFYT